MKSFLQRLTGILFLLLIANARATNLFVDLNCANPTPPYADWTTAATNIQDAISASAAGDTIFVTNGIYSTGGKTMDGVLTNRVALDKAITVQSVNGPFVTIIQGAGATNGTAAVRCAWLTNSASLVGFTLQFGATRMTGNSATTESGGGLWCASSNALVADCVIKSNAAFWVGGGVYQGTIQNCLISSNAVSPGPGGAACNAILNNCTVIGNSTYGAFQYTPGVALVTNCILYFNQNGNFSGGTYSHCCATPAPAGVGNFTNAPQLFADGVHLTITSPCIGAGVTPATSTDLFGKAWANPPAVGCAEYDAAPLATKPQIQLTSDPVGFTASAIAGGQQPLTSYWLKGGVPLQDDGHFNFTQTTNLVASGVNYSDAGIYQLVVSNASGVVTSAVAQLVIHCVNISGTNPLAPYSNWANAATNIQDAITAAAAGEIVLVTNGIYASGGKSMDGVLTNRVSVDKPILVQSVNGPGSTIIQGARDPISTNGVNAVRCVWMTNSTTLSGFTLRGGATSTNGNGGGVFGSVTNSPKPSANTVVANCLITGNTAPNLGGGAYRVTLIQCTVTSNTATGGGISSGEGGGAYGCNLKNCVLAVNSATSNGGGSSGSYSSLQNCALVQNYAQQNGGAANLGGLTNCTISANISGYSSGYGGAVYGATLVNCVVWGNFSRTSYPNTNYASCTLTYCCADPLASGAGNIFIDPQLLSDGIHILQTSPCRGAGASNVIVGTDIDGQPWNNPPAIGCDEWQPAPVIAIQPSFQIGLPAHGLAFNILAAGQSPFTYFWSKDGTPIQDDAHYSDSGTANLVANNFGPDDAGTYQVIVSNSVGVVTSQVAQVVIHVVDATGANPIAPYSTWSTAATNIQDAINIASAGDIVLVTNGIYSSGGKVMAGDLTNRVALDKAIAVTSVNGPFVTIIQGAWDPTSTNGPGAIRCAWLADGAMLNGFTLQNGATRAYTGVLGAAAESGGGVFCNSTKAIASNCVLSNNTASYGGGIAGGTLNDSLVTFNTTANHGFGGGAYSATLNNCTVVNNSTANYSSFPIYGGGTYNCVVRNSIVLGNVTGLFYEDNYYFAAGYSGARYSYSCTDPIISGIGNIDGNAPSAQRLDLFHIATTSPCRDAGNAPYTSGTDLDGEPWQNPPSMGCDEVIVSNLVGPLSVDLYAYQTNLLVNRYTFLSGVITGRASRVEWSFGDGPIVTNLGAGVNHSWTNSSDYTVTFTAYNNDNPAGVSTNTLIHVLPLNAPQLQSATLLTNGFQFQFLGQSNANFTVQYATNLAAPVWQTLQTIYWSAGQMYSITDAAGTNGMRFYRVLAQ
jgi:hypothetical protein